MRLFLTSFSLFSYVMGLVSLVCGLAGLVSPTLTLVCMSAFIAMGFIFIAEIDNCPI